LKNATRENVSNYPQSGRSLPAAPSNRKLFDVRKYPAERRINEQAALQIGLEQKAREFVDKGSEVYTKA